jgi:HAD superfamily hydrolase (TIGR01490 family)
MPGRRDTLPVGAFFDVDNTLLHGAALMQLARGAHGLGLIGARDLARFGWKALRFRQAGERLSVLDQVRDRGMVLLAGQPADGLHRLARNVVARMHHRFWPETRSVLREHLANGHAVWLISATPDFLAAEIAGALGATGGVGSPLEIVDGVFTGRFAGPTMHGEEKAVTARRLMREHGLDPADCYAYSDSINDLPLLTSVGTPVVVNPDRALAAHAEQHGWRVLRLDPASIRAERRRLRAEAGRRRIRRSSAPNRDPGAPNQDRRTRHQDVGPESGPTRRSGS